MSDFGQTRTKIDARLSLHRWLICKSALAMDGARLGASCSPLGYPHWFSWDEIKFGRRRPASGGRKEILPNEAEFQASTFQSLHLRPWAWCSWAASSRGAHYLVGIQQQRTERRSQVRCCRP